MTRRAIAPSASRGSHVAPRAASAAVVLAAIVLAAVALAGCSTLGNPPATENNDPAYATAQPNLASLSEVIQTHPDDPQAYNMRGAAFGEVGRS